MNSFFVSFFEDVVLLGLPFFVFPLSLCVFPGQVVNDVRAVGEARLVGGYTCYCYVTVEAVLRVFLFVMRGATQIYWPIIDPIEVYIIAGRIIFTPLILIVMIVSVATVVMFLFRLYFDYTRSVWLSLRYVLIGEASRISPPQEGSNKSTIDSILGEKLEAVYLPDRNLPQGHTEESWVSHLRDHGLYFPSWSMGYREKKSTPYIFVIDHAHRNASLCLYLFLGLVSFQFLATPVAVVYTIFMVALFVFQQVGLYTIYNISPYAYFVVDISFQLVGLFLATVWPEVFLFSCRPVQYLFMIFVSIELYFSWKHFRGIVES